MERMDNDTGELIMSAPGPMPAAIAAAIIAVKKGVKQLGSDERNQHGNYGYVSVDKFYERIGPLMANAGLAVMIDETDTEVRDSGRAGRDGAPISWLFASYALALVHESGVVAAPVRRSIALPINGPQTYGAAQSYIEKQFLRQIFKVPTGDRDADDTPQNDTPPAQRRSETRTAPEARPATTLPPQASQAAPGDPDARAEATKRYREIVNEIDSSTTAADLRAIREMPAWKICHDWIVKDRGEAVAEETMVGLVQRISRRAEMLAAEAGSNTRDYEV